MRHNHRRDATGASGAMTLDRAGPTAVAAVPMVTATISVGSESDAVAANPLTGSVYVTNQLDNTVSVISGQTNTISATIPVGSPQGMAVNPLTGDVYVTNFNDSTVSVISGQTNTVSTTIPVGSLPISVAVNPPTGDVYVTNFNEGTVSVISGRTNNRGGTDRGIRRAARAGVGRRATTVLPPDRPRQAGARRGM